MLISEASLVILKFTLPTSASWQGLLTINSWTLYQVTGHLRETIKISLKQTLQLGILQQLLYYIAWLARMEY